MACSVPAESTSAAVPAREILRTEQIVAFLPDVPAVVGHTLIVPRVHVPDIRALDSVTAAALAAATQVIAEAAWEAAEAEGLNVIQSNGTAAGQTVFHLHIHVVPRTIGDRMPDLWPRDVTWSFPDLENQAQSLRRALG